jgi:hypothetical protein
LWREEASVLIQCRRDFHGRESSPNGEVDNLFCLYFEGLEGVMKNFLKIMLALLLVAAMNLPVFAWEFEMQGEFETRFRYFGRTGINDLFGRGNIQSDAAAIPSFGGGPVPAVGVGFAGPNIYGYPGHFFGGPIIIPGDQATTALTGTPLAAAFFGFSPGVRVIRGGYSEFDSDAYIHDSRLTLYPSIRLNPAIRWDVVLNIGGLRHKYMQYNSAVSNFSDIFSGATPAVGVPAYERYYVHQTSMNAYDTAAIPSIEQFRFTVQMPWAIWSAGVKDFPFGLGATLSHATRNEAFLTAVPYGPFRFIHCIWLARSVRGRGDTNAINGSPGIFGLDVVDEGWGTVPDSGSKPSFFQGLFFTYESGNLGLGFGSIFRNYHANLRFGENVQTTPALPTPTQFDQNLRFWLAYMKYFNGRFFANAEYSWINVDNYRIGDSPRFQEAYHAFSELGAACGPARLTLMGAISSGPVLNNNNVTKVYQPFPINYQAMEPYEWLMFNVYGGGNQTFGGLFAPSDGHGMMSDAYAYAARLDYALAANLNIWASYLWAHRLERAGTGFGTTDSVGMPFLFFIGDSAGRLATFAALAGRAPGGPAQTAPFGYVSNGFIGWEADAGIDWQLLDGLVMRMRYAYWQPGDWFREAYQAVVVTGAGAVTNSGVLGSRDPINAFSISLLSFF